MCTHSDDSHWSVALATAVAQLTETVEAQRRALVEIQQVLAQTRQELHDVLNRLERDMLTGAYNRHGMDVALAREISRVNRSMAPLSVVMVDVDGFKVVNDTHGHQAGDQLLRQVAAHIKQVLRESDTLVRFGGDEFLLILPDTDAISASCLIERLRQAAHPLLSNGKTIHYTLSAGAVQWEPGENAHALVGRADEQLYRVKHERYGKRQPEKSLTFGRDEPTPRWEAVELSAT